MYIYMGHMKYEHTKPYEDSFWKKNKIDLIYDHVIKVDTASRSLHLNSGATVLYDTLIIATGSTSNKFDWPGQNLKGVQSLYSYPDLRLMEESTKGAKQAVIVGGGLIGIEMAEMLLSKNIGVTFLVREPEFWSIVLPRQEASMISRHIRSHHVQLILDTELKTIQGDKDGNVKSVTTNKNKIIDCDFVGLTVGVSPNIRFLKDSTIETGSGVLVDEYLQTNIADVYAIGDCAERTYDLPGRKYIEQIWYTGRMMGEVVAQSVCGSKTRYEPGPWFNSAKFFDIEYQTYGNVMPELKSNEEDFYWEHASGLKALHVVWDKDTKEFRGINAFGLRLRHERFDIWLRQKKDIGFIIENLSETNFDPEFFVRHETEIIKEFFQQFPNLKIRIAS